MDVKPMIKTFLEISGLIFWSLCHRRPFEYMSSPQYEYFFLCMYSIYNKLISGFQASSPQGSNDVTDFLHEEMYCPGKLGKQCKLPRSEEVFASTFSGSMILEKCYCWFVEIKFIDCLPQKALK
ncbi:hypothetical protein PoB_007273900 [Plakobranchus ocellatus]|uniref:Uncharacterized protein n=1 Tax=Plakobranchus ocellatus TaxID=259542 RepID=A0AAV4DPX9_9GAST|nr:hypothetical protein PoB_007273900 [Plakobranchus ocellatus]